MSEFSWTDERVEKLITLWNGGSSASEIALKLKGVSRNAVIGKLKRLREGGDKRVKRDLSMSGRGHNNNPRPAKVPPNPNRPKTRQAHDPYDAQSLFILQQAERDVPFAEIGPAVGMTAAEAEAHFNAIARETDASEAA